MIQLMCSAFVQAFENLRTNFFHTLLSILGIIIGVASLVAILSLIDGMEKYARDQISSTTSLKNITIRTITSKTINSVQVKKDSFDYLQYSDLASLQQKISGHGKAYLISQKTNELTVSKTKQSLAALTIGIAPDLPISQIVSTGRRFNIQDVETKNQVTIINKALAELITKDTIYDHLLNTTIVCNQTEYSVVGILNNSPLVTPTFIIPFTCLDENQFKTSPPMGNIEVENIENVLSIKKQAQAWIDERFKSNVSDFECITNEFRVDQVRKGFLLFKIVMGLIVGISVVVGGIGIMNVLLISVKERTMEIGIRKAIGANRRDIMRLFLSESLTLSLLGSVLGVLLGVLIDLIAIPIIKSFTKAPFQVAFTFNTILIIGIVSVLIGIVFGTYPARKAAMLDAVVAIQRN